MTRSEERFQNAKIFDGQLLFCQMGSAIEDVSEWEQKVEDCQDAFQKISEVIKVRISNVKQRPIH